MVDQVAGATKSNEVATREGELIEQDGVRYRIITAKEAFDLRLDVQLYDVSPDGFVIMDSETPQQWRRNYEQDKKRRWTNVYTSLDSDYWKNPLRRSERFWAIEVDDTKPEYVSDG